MLEIRRANERGHFDFGWLNTYHSFSFGEYYDAQQMGFSDLRVINDDRIAAGGGFPTHPHRDMEIFTYVLDGALSHKDSMGNGSVIRRGDVQMMSAGKGIMHSEFNASDEHPVHLLQIWILPALKNVLPRYQQTHYSDEEKRGRLRLIIAPNSAGALDVYQDLRVYAGMFDGAEAASLNLAAGRHAYVHVASGALEVNGQRLVAGDGARLREAGEINFSAGEAAEVLLFDLRAES